MNVCTVGIHQKRPAH